MENSMSRLAITSLVAGVCAILLALSVEPEAFAQAGSTGGTVGKTDKSASGGEEKAEPQKPVPKRDRRAGKPPSNEASSETRGSSCGRIVGTWNWVFGLTVVIKSNGSMTASNGLTATWTCSDGQYSFAWSNNITDRVSLSKDGNQLDAVNSMGIHFSSTRF
jgi:hypothetical protein